MKRSLWLCLILAALSACATSQQSLQQGVVEATLLVFNEKRPGEEAQILRMAIGEDFIRIDNGPGSEDFLLFDGRKQVLYNVVAEDQSILVIDPAAALPAGGPVNWQDDREKSHALIRRDDTNALVAEYHHLSLEGRSCYHVVSADLLPQVLPMLRDYQKLLARDLAARMTSADDEESRCFNAIRIHDYARNLAYGMPIREWDNRGYQRFLVDYKPRIRLEEVHYRLPAGYRHYSLAP